MDMKTLVNASSGRNRWLNEISIKNTEVGLEIYLTSSAVIRNMLLQ